MAPGQNEVATLPTSRGFNSHYGYWTGAEDHYNHQSPQINGSYDFADNLRTCREANGTHLATTSLYSVLFLSSKGVVIRHAPSSYIWLSKTCTGHFKPQKNTSNVTPTRQEKTGVDNTWQRWPRLPMMRWELLSAMERTGLKDSSLIIFLSDNGGPTNGNEGTWSSNYPLRAGRTRFGRVGRVLWRWYRGWGSANPKQARRQRRSSMRSIGSQLSFTLHRVQRIGSRARLLCGLVAKLVERSA